VEDLCNALAERIDRHEDRRQFLDEALKVARNDSGLDAASAQRASKATPPSLRSTELHIPPDEAERARRALSRVLGPIAQILVQRALKKAQSTDELWEMLANEIGSPRDRAEFLQQRD
jgi:hypothetical protein